MPVPVQKTFGTALRDVQHGETPAISKRLSGFGGGTVLELIEDYNRGAFGMIYTVNFPGAVYVLHVFQKKSRRGIQTPRQDVELIRSRLRLARAHYELLQRTED